jgi:hypothetical protein
VQFSVIQEIVLTGTGSQVLGTFNTTEPNQRILVQANANLFGEGAGSGYSLGIEIDGSSTSLFVNSARDLYPTYDDLRFTAFTQSRIFLAPGQHTARLIYVIGPGDTLTTSNMVIVLQLVN